MSHFLSVCLYKVYSLPRVFVLNNYVIESTTTSTTVIIRCLIFMCREQRILTAMEQKDPLGLIHTYSLFARQLWKAEGRITVANNRFSGIERMYFGKSECRVHTIVNTNLCYFRIQQIEGFLPIIV